jgi:hypothetical protein
MLKSITNYIHLGLLVTIFISCNENDPSVFFSDKSISIQFLNLRTNQFRSMKSSNVKGIDLRTYKYLSKGEQPNIAIAIENNGSPYEKLQKGQREIFFFDFIPDFFEEIFSLPTHTEVLNDTTFLLGQMWFEYDGTDKLEPNVKGSNGWVASIIRPQTVIYVNIWFEDRSIHVDSLLFWSLSVREELIVDFPDFSLGLGMF